MWTRLQSGQGIIAHPPCSCGPTQHIRSRTESVGDSGSCILHGDHGQGACRNPGIVAELGAGCPASFSASDQNLLILDCADTDSINRVSMLL